MNRFLMKFLLLSTHWEMCQIFILITTVLLLFCVSSVSKSEPALNLGDYLFALQSYDEAITEYKRFLFFHPDDTRAGYALYKIGLAYRSEHRWTEAIEFMKASIQKTEDAMLKAERGIDLAVTMIANGRYSVALLELLKVSTESQSGQLCHRAIFLQGVAHLYMFNWELARQAFKVYFDASPELQCKAKEIDVLFDEAIHRPQKSTTIAKILSTILPGAGQAYAGDWKNGLNALALNGLLVFISVNAASNRDNSLVIFASLFLRYYFGNQYRAGEVAKQFNNRINHQYAVKILQTLTLQSNDKQ